MKKTNRTFKRFAAITSASLLAACAVAPVFTSMTSYAATSYTMTLPESLPDDVEITSVTAYKIFNGSFDSDNNTFNVTEWANSTTLADILEKTPDGSVKTALTGKTAPQAAVAISAFTPAELEIFAKAVSQGLTTTTNTVVSESGTYANGAVTFANELAAGYYAVLCTIQDGTTTTHTAKSLGMLTVAGDGDTTPEIGLGEAKVSLPQVEKKVKENVKAIKDKATYETSDEKWNDVADYNIGDPVPFKLYGTLPADLDKYSAYYYCFNDTLGSQFDMPSKDDVIVKINGTPVTQGNNLRVEIDGRNISVSFEDIKPLVPNNTDGTINTNAIVTVEYSAVLNQTAEIGLNGQENKVDLTYSNNPNFNYKPDTTNTGKEYPTETETGTTPEDKAIVFTYELDVTKKFLNAAGEEISKPSDVASIKFNLSNGESNITFIKVGDYYYPSTETGSSADLKLDANNKILIKGLDAATYTLIEAEGPKGFNKADNTPITITATTVNNQAWNDFVASSALTGFNYTIGSGDTAVTYYQKLDSENKTITENSEDGTKIKDIDAIAKATVENRQGSTLPGTGGIGTTIFYLGGGAMAAIGGVYLISKRRMKKSEE